MARTKNAETAKEAVRIRFKKLANGNKSIYLDIYRDGVRSYEFLKLYITPKTDAESKAANQNRLQIANNIKAQRILEIDRGDVQMLDMGIKSKMPIKEWLISFLEDQKRKGHKDAFIITSLIRVLEQMGEEKRMLKHVNKRFVLSVINYLRTEYMGRHGNGLADVTKNNILTLFSMSLNKAVREDIINVNPFTKIDMRTEGIKRPESQRVYLTIDELKRLIATPCKPLRIRKGFEHKYAIIRQAFLFACFCGLRISDVKALRWGDLSKSEGEVTANIRQQKTKEPLSLPLSENALKWLPERGSKKDDDLIFEDFSLFMTERLIKRWAKDAGINKNVTFHTSRHTFATMMLTLDANIYTVRDLLGHTSVKTTEIYAKIVNQKKVEAVNLTSTIKWE